MYMHANSWQIFPHGLDAITRSNDHMPNLSRNCSGGLEVHPVKIACCLDQFGPDLAMRQQTDLPSSRFFLADDGRRAIRFLRSNDPCVISDRPILLLTEQHRVVACICVAHTWVASCQIHMLIEPVVIVGLSRTGLSYGQFTHKFRHLMSTVRLTTW